MQATMHPNISHSSQQPKLKINRRSCSRYHARKNRGLFYCLFIPLATARSSQQPKQIKNRRSCTIYHARKIMRVFYCLFIPLATARTNHRIQQPPQARGSAAKILKINLLPLNLLINLRIKTTFSFLLH